MGNINLLKKDGTMETFPNNIEAKCRLEKIKDKVAFIQIFDDIGYLATVIPSVYLCTYIHR